MFPFSVVLLPSLFVADPAVLILDSLWCCLLLLSLLSPLPSSSAFGIRLVLPLLWSVDLVVIIVESSWFCSVVVVFGLLSSSPLSSLKSSVSFLVCELVAVVAVVVARRSVAVAQVRCVRPISARVWRDG